MKRFLCVLILALLAIPAWAASTNTVAVEMTAERLRVAPGSTVTVAIAQKIAPGWHTYWSNPGEAGMPTTVAWKLPPGWKAGPIQWPTPKREPVGPLMDYGYEGTVWLLSDLTVPADARPDSALTLAAHVQWLVCREVCIPEESDVSTEVFVEKHPPPANAIDAERFAQARAHIPTPSPWPVVYAAAKPLRLFLAAANLASGSASPASVEYFPARSGLIVDAAVQKRQSVSGGVVLALTPAETFKPGTTLDGVIVLTSSDGTRQALSIAARPGEIPSSGGTNMGPWLAMVFAFLGGLILNIMPCVLPILAMKVLAMAEQAGGERKRTRIDALAYTAGVLISFVLLGATLVALRTAGHAIGWGFQLQEPAVVAVLGMLLFAVGLNLIGVFEVGSVSAGESLTRRSGAAGAFFTGVLAVAVAAPCTAPFMAPAIGFGLTQSPAITMGIFAALGMGFALPFLLLAAFPVLNRFLPKPGTWMIRLKQIMAVPMFAAALWLIWVLARQVSHHDLALAVLAFAVLGGGAWAFGASRFRSWRRLGTGIAILGVIAALAGASVLRANADDPVRASHAETYSPSRLANLRAQKRGVFVDVSASWCITCMVNEEAALNRPAVRKAFAEKGIVLLKADWTRKNPEITLLLEAHGRSGVPLYLYYPPGGDAVELPQILTEADVLKIAR